MSGSSWEEAWRQANTPQQRRFLEQEAERRGEHVESLVGLLRSTYPRVDPEAPGAPGEAEIAGEQATEALSEVVVPPVGGEWWE